MDELIMNRIIEAILRVVFWGIQLCAVSALPVGLIVFLKKKRVKKIGIIAVAILLVTCLTVTAVSLYPPVICPEEYEEYIDEADIQRIRGFNNGLHSWNIPVFPILIRIDYGGISRIDVTTHYFFAGTTQMTIDSGGPSITKGLFWG